MTDLCRHCHKPLVDGACPDPIKVTTRIEVPCSGCSTDPCYHWPYCTELLSLRAEYGQLLEAHERLREERDNAIDAEKIALCAIGKENDRLRAAARLPDPTYSSTDGRVCCVYCGSIEENGHSEACPWVKLNVALSLGGS